MNFTVRRQNEATVRTQEVREGEVTYLNVTVDFPAPTSPKPVEIDFFFDCVDIYSVFSPTVDLNTALSYDWAKNASSSRISAGMPVHSLLSLDGRNRLTIALSDGLSPLRIATGVHEEDATMACTVTLFSQPVGVISHYEVTLRLDFSDLPFYEVLSSVEGWWRAFSTPALPPKEAYDGVFSTWYCYHQEMDAEDILRECAKASKLGLKTVIIDDGWQTEDTARGYAYCGDWKLSTQKIPDIHAFVEGLHALGMKVLFWFSLPYIGSKSQAFTRFKEYFLDDIPEGFDGQATLDARFPAAREHVKNAVVGNFIEWNLDGLKLDFIDAFSARRREDAINPEWDTPSLEEAVDKLLREITDEVKRVKRDALIEFRQPYMGHAVRKYGNLFRVSDCPDDMMKNRFYSVNLRLLLHGSAVHSDMLVWNENERDEAVFRQLCSTLFTVPQISMKPSKLSPAHLQILSNFLAYHAKNRELLLCEKLKAYRPEAHYSHVSAENAEKQITLVYLPVPIALNRRVPRIELLNCSTSETLLLTGEPNAKYSLEMRDIYGNQRAKKEVVADGTGAILLSVEKECYLFLTKLTISS